ncbi:MAG: hypothetical protein QOJ88_326 [Pyrinomonadaceae bacterium]|jgi:hypothetical protein|nr:hypothetical protein [Pyrinomonadaceae bacterium]
MGVNTPTNGDALYHGAVSKRRLPVNYDPRDVALFSHELEKVIPATTLQQLRDVRVSADGIFFRGRRMLPESFAFPANLELWNWRGVLKFFVANYAGRRRRTLTYDVLWITDDWSNGYFHWLTDALTRLFVMRERLDELVLLLPWDYQARNFVTASLRAFGVDRVEFIARDEVLRCPSVFLPTHTAPSGHYNEEILLGVRRLLLQTYGEAAPSSAGERIYLSRGRARKRKIHNEAAVLELMAEFGFETIYAEDISFEQQVKIFSRARYFVSNHGAGLTNMLFMPSGASVLELRHQTDCVNNCYFTLASALDLKYFYQTCPSVADLDPHAADLVVDSSILRTNLQLLLKA